MAACLSVAMMEEIAVYAGCIGLNIGLALYAFLEGHLMSKGLNPFFLVSLGNLAACCFFLPFAVYFERKRWPRRLGLNLMWKFLLYAIGWIALFQPLMQYGVKETSPALSSITPNLAPGFIFIIAWVLRYEKVDIKCLYTHIKILGTIVCLVGAILMSVMQTITKDDTHTDKSRVYGTLCLIAAVIILSLIIILQAKIMSEFPAPMSLTVVASFIGAILTSIIQMIQQCSLEISSNFVIGGYLIGYVILGGIGFGVCSILQTWAIRKKGPLFYVSFCSVNTLFSVILAAIALGESITLGSFAGMIVMCIGLYSVLWAKKKEELTGDKTKVSDAERPLLK